jgi:copper homeostasis protein
MLLEIAVFNTYDALNAANAGANRLEICSNYEAGGITCTQTDLEKIRTLTHIPLFAIVRPRGGNFVYNKEEFLQMQQTILLCKKLEYNGVVLGILNEDDTIDVERTKQLVEIANPLPVTFHRAFDKVPNFEIALDAVIKTGCKRILTSGGKSTAYEGKETLKHLIKKASSNIIIIPGGGIRNHHLLELIQQTNATEFHSAAITNGNNICATEIELMLQTLSKQKSPQPW